MKKKLVPFEETFEIPKSTGLSGFLSVISSILKQPMVQLIEVTPSKVRYKRMVQEGSNSMPLEIELETLTPYAVLRNCREIYEFEFDDKLDFTKNVFLVLFTMFREVNEEQLYPICWMSGTRSLLFDHIKAATDRRWRDADDFMGLPFRTDAQIEDNILILCAGANQSRENVDVEYAFRLLLPEVK